MNELCWYQGRAERCHKPASRTARRPACTVDTAAGWTTDSACRTVWPGYTCSTVGMDCSTDHSVVMEDCTDTVVDRVDTEDTVHRPAHTGY